MNGVRSHIRTIKRRAWCLDCAKRWEGPNALAVAARHTAAHRHTTRAEAATEHAFVPDAS